MWALIAEKMPRCCVGLIVLGLLWCGGLGFESPRAALLIVDVQDCFLQNGSLAVPEGNDVIPVINGIRQQVGQRFEMTIFSQDWHCPAQVSFASNHQGLSPGQVVALHYAKTSGKLCLGSTVQNNSFPEAVDCSNNETVRVDQMLWPDHCVQNVSSGPTSSGFAHDLIRTADDVVVQKGVRCEVDSYSVFFDNGRLDQTVLDSLLKSRDINTLFITGLALDYCVLYTARDAHGLGYVTNVITDATRGVDPVTSAQAVEELSGLGVGLITADSVGEVLDRYNRTGIHGSGNGGNSAPVSSIGLLLAGATIWVKIIAHLC